MMVSEPMMVAEDVVMFWTEGSKHHSEYDNIAEFDDVYPGYLNNTVIKKGGKIII